MPFKRRKSSRGGSSRTERRQGTAGLFEPSNRKWYCDCDLRVAAIVRTVKKAGPNRGRKFYGCQQDEDVRCDFFLWEEDALARQDEATVVANTNPDPNSNGSSTRGVRGNSKQPTTPPPRTRQTTLTTPPPPTQRPQPQPQPHTPNTQRIFRGIPLDPDSNRRGFADGDDDDIMSMSTDAQIEADEAMERRRLDLARFRAPPRLPPSPPKRKRADSGPAATRSGFLDDGEEDEDESLDSDMERQLVALTDSASRASRAAPMSTQRAADPTPTTPAKQRYQIQGPGNLPTPQSHHSSRGRDTIAAPLPITASTPTVPAKRVRLSTPSGGIASPTSTPTPRSVHDPLPLPSSSSPFPFTSTLPLSSSSASEEDYDITREILALLDSHNNNNQSKPHLYLSTDLRATLRDRLNTWALRAEGVRRGRDMAREVVAARDARVAALQERVAFLENARRVDRERIRVLREGLRWVDEGEDDDGEGRG